MNTGKNQISAIFPVPFSFYRASKPGIENAERTKVLWSEQMRCLGHVIPSSGSQFPNFQIILNNTKYPFSRRALPQPTFRYIS